jgi:polyisoprenoid-binding protein YceI
MQKKLILCSVLALAVSASAVASPKAASPKGKGVKTVALDASSGQLTWTGTKVVGSHTGTIGLKEGKVEVKGTEITGGQFTIDMTSIVNTDLTDKTWNGKLVGHLKSEDFFAVEKFPTAQFTITQIKKLSGANAEATHEITGNLTLRDQTHPVSFPAKIEVKDGMAQAKGSLKIDRTQFGIKYNSGQFFKNLGDKMINDQFQVDLNVHAKI